MTRRPRLVGILFVLALFGAACASSGEPTGFEQQPGPINDDWAAALGNGVSTDAVPLVQRNFLEGCITIDEGKRYVDLELNEVGLIAVCGCGYDGIVATLLNRDDLSGETQEDRERDAFNKFKDLDKALGDIDKPLDSWVRTIFTDCIRSESAL